MPKRPRSTSGTSVDLAVQDQLSVSQLITEMVSVGLDRTMINLLDLGMPASKINSATSASCGLTMINSRAQELIMVDVDLDVSRETILVSKINRQKSILNDVDHGALDQEGTMIDSSRAARVRAVFASVVDHEEF